METSLSYLERESFGSDNSGSEEVLQVAHLFRIKRIAGHDGLIGVGPHRLRVGLE